MYICIYTSVEKIVTIEQLCTQTFFLLLCCMSMTDRKKGREGRRKRDRERKVLFLDPNYHYTRLGEQINR